MTKFHSTILFIQKQNTQDYCKKLPYSFSVSFPSPIKEINEVDKKVGYKISQIPTRTIQAIFIPRNELEDAIEDNVRRN